MDKQTTKLSIKGELDKKKVLIFGLLGLILLTSAIAGVSLIVQQRSQIDLGVAATLTSALPSSLTAKAGDYYNYKNTVKLESNTARNLSILYKLNTTLPISSGDVKLRLLDGASVLIGESSTVTNGEVLINLTNDQYPSVTSKDYYTSVEFLPSSPNGSYGLSFTVLNGNNNFIK